MQTLSGASLVLLFLAGAVFAAGAEAKRVTPNRAPDHSLVPGVVLNHSPARSGIYLGCPGIAILPDGRYVASHSYFGPKSKRNRMTVFRSADRGKTWRRLTDVTGQWWSSLFVHGDSLYLMGVSEQYGAVVIRRSKDAGETWTQPKDGATGLLIARGRYHCAPVPVVVCGGRIWRAFEEVRGAWGTGFCPFVMSAPAGADLLRADSWATTNRLAWGDWKPYAGWLEGNVVLAPEGQLLDILRVHETRHGGKAAVVKISADGKEISFDPKTGFIDFPGGCKKFTIRYDPATKLYWSLVNWIPPKYAGKHNAERSRNVLALSTSPDAIAWTPRSIVLDHPDIVNVGFQYVDWQFDGPDLISAIRTAHPDGLGGAHNCHDSNYFVFLRIPDFRERTMKDAPMNGK